jgi:phosphodiesterase/alkaline phosphatase D-like protein
MPGPRDRLQGVVKPAAMKPSKPGIGHPSRRGVLAGLGALPVVGACGKDGPPGGGDEPPQPAPDRPAEPLEWEPSGDLDESAFPASVAAGDATPDGVIVSVHTTEPQVTLIVVGAIDQGWEEIESRVGLVPADGVVQVELTGLQADRSHRYVFTTIDGARRSRVGRFRTALADDGYRKVVFGATSCLGSSNPEFPNLGFVAEHELDFFVLLGDTVYADGSVTREDYRGVWSGVLAKETVRSTFAATSVVATWDDHEVANNWVLGEGSALRDGVTEQQLADAGAVFRECVPQRVGPDGPWYRALRWGTVLELIVLDCRGERTETTILSEAQLAWATDRIRTSPARFKIVLVSVHATDHTALLSTVQAEDRWQGYPDQRDALIAAAEESPGTLFVTGDMHYGAIQKLGAAGAPGDGLWEVAAGPSGSQLMSVSGLTYLLGGVPEQYVDLVETWNWARFEVDPGLGEIRVQLIGDDGAVLVDRVLSL